MNKKYVIVDLETTGNSPSNGDKIIQFAGVLVQNGNILETFSSLVSPGREIPAFILELTRLEEKEIASAPPFSAIAPKIVDMLEGAYFVAHNVQFDLTFLQAELKEAGYEPFIGPVLDTVEMARIFFPTVDSFRLNDLALEKGFDHFHPHQADSDAYVTAELFLLLIKRIKNLPIVTLKQLLKLSRHLKSDLSLLIEDILTEKEKRIEELSPSLITHHGIVLKRPKEHMDETEDHFEYQWVNGENENLLHAVIPNYEERQGQFKMMDVVYQSFIKGRHTFIEGETGVGKTIAYLLPVAIFSKQKNEKVVISTYTNHLQQQLLEKEISRLEKVLPFSLKVVLLKGRNHYISLAKFEQSLKEQDNHYDSILAKMQILVWLTETETGDRDELNLSSGGLLYWDKIQNTEMTYLQNQHWHELDFFQRIKKKANSADLILANHSLIVTDFIYGEDTLPSYSYCILDEGHHFHQVARKHFGDQLKYTIVRRKLNIIRQLEQKWLQFLDEKNILLPDYTAISFETTHLLTDLDFEVEQFFQSIVHYVRRNKKNEQSKRIAVMISKGKKSKHLEGITNAGERIYFLLKDVMKNIRTMVELVSHSDITLSNWEKKLIEDIDACVKELESLHHSLKRIILSPSESFVTWVEIDQSSIQSSLTIYSEPISIAEDIQERFFQRKKSVVITSATLSVKNKFDYIMNELGMDKKDCVVEKIAGDFNYSKQVKLLIANDLPDVNKVSLEEYVAAISEHILSIAETLKGRMLVLFTSYEMLRKTFTLLKEISLLDDFVLFGQGVTPGSPTRLVRQFLRFEKAILLGTNSFWEGIDLPGEDLSAVVVVRLPFSSPNEPFHQAKCEAIRNDGGNPFYDFSLPEAVIRFKQGFGRLIRTEHDYGYFIILDQRILSTRYGKVFLQSIPPTPVQSVNINEMIEIISN